MKKDKQEVEYKEKSGTAWSHSYLNQKPWHPLSYPNQRRKWIAEQTHAQKEDRRAEVAREFAQEQEFFRQTAQMSKKEKEKMEIMQAVSFMYMRPPGYNAEAARAAEIADERKRLGLTTSADVNITTNNGDTSTDFPEKRVARSKDVFGRTLPTEEEFPALKNAPRHDTGAPTRVKPFAVEIRNVKCARCGAFGHQSGDRECPLKDVLMPSEEARLIREDPLNAILAQTASAELFSWELKQKPGGLSPARGGFKPDDPNQQIIPDEDIYDEYGGFLAGGGDEETLSIPKLLASLSHEQRKVLTSADGAKKHEHKKQKKAKKGHKRSHSRKSENRSDHDLVGDRHGGDRQSTSSEDEQRNRKGEPDSSEDDDKIHVYRDEGKSNNGEDQGSHKPLSRREAKFDLSNKKKHRSKCRSPSGNIDGKNGSQRSIVTKNLAHIEDTHHKGGNRIDTDDETNRRRHKGRSDSNDDEHKRPTRKDRWDSSDDEKMRPRHKYKRIDKDDESSRHRRKSERDGGDDEQKKSREEDQGHHRDEEERRRKLKGRRHISDGGEQKKPRKENKSHHRDEEERRLRLKDRRNTGDDDEQKIPRYYDEEERGMRLKDRRITSDDRR